MGGVKKALVVVEGIRDRDYPIPDLSEFFSKVELVDTESKLDGWILTGDFLNNIPFLGKYLDKHGDWLKYALLSKRREELSDLIKVKIERLRKQGYEHITLLGHSLGAWMVLSTDVAVDCTILCGCPASFKYLPIRSFIKSTLKNKHILRTKRLLDFYSENDRVGNRELDCEIVQSVMTGQAYHCNTKKSHSFYDYIMALKAVL